MEQLPEQQFYFGEDAESWEQMARFCKAGILMGDARCMSSMAEIICGKKTKEAEECEDPFKEAVSLWQQAAEKGDGRSATNLGLLHLHKPIPGAGKLGELEYDEEKALAYFIKGYENGDMKAGRHVGLCYKEGRGTEKDDAKAFEWFGKAAERGDSSAQLFIADSLLDGIGTEQNVPEAIERYKALVECNGHDVDELEKVFKIKTKVAKCIIANTIKGKECDFVRDKNGFGRWHAQPYSDEDYQKITDRIK